MELEKNIIIIDYGVGNIGSIVNMFKALSVNVVVSSCEKTIRTASHLILPGVGSFGYGMGNLKKSNLIQAINDAVIINKKPILGICLGMQLLFERSEESKNHLGLGWLKGSIKKFNSRLINKPVPHMGWDLVIPKSFECIFKDSFSERRYYFVHSYYVCCDNTSDILATTTYGNEFTSVVKKNNIYGVQFHPEKSHKFGCCLLNNFIRL